MPRMIPKTTHKAICKQCGWHLIYSTGGHGDCINFKDANKLFYGRPPKVCPACNSTDFKTTGASLIETMNPFEKTKNIAYQEKHPNTHQDEP